MKPYFSLILPVYNEQERIHNVHEVDSYLRKLPFASEIIIVNDGSEDKTGEIVRSLTLQVPFFIIEYTRNMGKGYAIKRGMLDARGDIRAFIDIDLSTSLAHLHDFVAATATHPVVVGTRKHPKSFLKKRQPMLRELMGKGYTKLAQCVLSVKASDFTCGCKCFSADAAVNIFTRAKISRWSFDSEILFLAKSLGYPIAEIPVSWSDDRRSKVRFPHDIIRSFVDLLRLRFLHSHVGKKDHAPST
jgi:dolichyl-phosphate beta-glucosyltransferase